MSFSNYLETAVLNHLFTTTSYTRPTTIHIGLFTSNPGETGGGTEVSSAGTGYARASVTNDGTTFTVTDDTAINSGAVINFPTPTAGWGTVTHFAAFDASTAGNMLFYALLPSSKTINSGDTVRFDVDTLSVTLD